MMSNSMIQQAREYVRSRLYGEGTGHDWWHIHRVTEIAQRIATQVQADAFVCILAALFHDLADEKVVGSTEAGMREIHDWLDAHDVQASVRDHILEIIATMSFKGGHGEPMKTLEGKVVQDADRLDAIGAIGIARTFAYAGSKGHILYDPDIPPRTSMTEEQYRKDTNTAINHFYEKLLKLQGLMNTDYGKQLAASRHGYMENFLEQFYGEWKAEK
jgi:uncharacterized protein